MIDETKPADARPSRSRVPSVGAVVVTYNSATTISACLASLVGQVSDVVVVDSGSTDATRDIVRAGGVRLLASANDGFGAGCNKGVAQLDTDFVFFVNPDAAIDPGVVDRLLAVASAAQAHGIRVALSPMFEGDDSCEGFRLWFFSVGRLVARLRRRPPVQPSTVAGLELLRPERLSGAAMFVSRSDFVGVGGFDTRFFLYFEDADLSLRLRAHGVDLAIVPGAVSKHLKAVSSSTLPSIDTIRGRSSLLFVRKHRGRVAAWLAGCDLVVVTLAGCIALLIRGRWRETRVRARRLRALGYLRRA